MACGIANGYGSENGVLNVLIVVIRSMGRVEERGEAPALRRGYDRPSSTRRFDSAGHISHFARPTLPSLSHPCPPFHDPNPLVWTSAVSTNTFFKAWAGATAVLLTPPKMGLHRKPYGMYRNNQTKTLDGIFYLPTSKCAIYLLEDI
jgi:hypothetical protein